VEDSIVIRGAKLHNLKNISLEIPHNKLTVVTGVSGSGKSSLVFDTIYAEGQRRYVESLSAYARQFLERMEKPEVDEIEGLAPPIAIRQKNTSRNPRSTVATSTELYDFLRLLYARVGRTYCPKCGQFVQRDTVDQVAQRVLAEPEGTRWYVLFPVRLPQKSAEMRDRLFDLRQRGFNRLYQDGRTFEFSTPESLLDIDFTRPLHVLVDRIVMSSGLRQRVVDSVEICYREAGEVIFEQAGAEPPRRLVFNEKFACKTCNIEFLTPEPRLFSFNNPFGACPRCQGFGNTLDYDFNLIIPDPTLSLDEGAIDAFVLIAEDYLENGTVYYYRPDFNPMEGFDLSAELEHIINTNLLGENQALLARVQNPLNMEMEVLNPEPQRDPGNMLTFFLPYAVTFLFYIVILSSASLMLSSITSEKQNRVIEILMTSITPMQMLTGKIIALGLAGLFQTIVWTTAGLLLLRVSGTTFSLPAEFQLPVSIIFWGAIFFLLGYAVYASLMAGAGALVPNLRESSQVTTILVIPMVIPLMMINPLIQQPNGTIAVVLSLFPLTAPVSMMTRLAGTQVPIWQILLSILLLAITAALVIRAVSGMFRAQNLLSGQPFRMNVFFKALLGRL